MSDFVNLSQLSDINEIIILEFKKKANIRKILLFLEIQILRRNLTLNILILT